MSMITAESRQRNMDCYTDLGFIGETKKEEKPQQEITA